MGLWTPGEALIWAALLATSSALLATSSALLATSSALLATSSALLATSSALPSGPEVERSLREQGFSGPVYQRGTYGFDHYRKVSPECDVHLADMMVSGGEWHLQLSASPPDSAPPEHVRRLGGPQSGQGHALVSERAQRRPQLHLRQH